MALHIPAATPTTAEACLSPETCRALAWHRRQLAELERQVASDCLTGLWNRVHFDRLLEAELDRSRQYRQPVSLILFDIDYFKRVNDATAAHEETLLAQRGFAQLDTHRRTHAGLLERAQTLQREWQDGAARLGAIVEFIAGEVVARHLFRADWEFFPLFAAPG